MLKDQPNLKIILVDDGTLNLEKCPTLDEEIERANLELISKEPDSAESQEDLAVGESSDENVNVDLGRNQARKRKEKKIQEK